MTNTMKEQFSMEVVNLNTDRKHEVIHYYKMGFDVDDISIFFDMPKFIVLRFIKEFLNSDPTPPEAA